jgi:hypothetical protein
MAAADFIACSAPPGCYAELFGKFPNFPYGSRCYCNSCHKIVLFSPLESRTPGFAYTPRERNPMESSWEQGGEVIGSSMMAPRHTALMLYVSIWMKPLATDGLEVEAQ